ncbi:septum formation protein [Legionella busanensis]|uniref:Nucleoside triphosphate pyrophosphatase n=1 Tax=Legionella busanensis TaxID=190655 RepID=A0A378JK21_9GAMM|nr:Maf family nucleotide pyrophosphatase [Legionella busanensis]STX50569.1 septum formation protein [Legionella busanensis]
MSNFLIQKPLILASGSKIRKQLLKSLGLEFKVIPSNSDEALLKNQLAYSTPIELARALAADKALIVSRKYPDSYVIAADQICVMDNCYFDKPENHEVATSHLRQLRGKTHQQIAAFCIAKAGKLLFEGQDIALLSMKLISDQTIETYLQADKPYQSCGAYNYESRAKWLFTNVEGQDSTIQGLPLLPLVQALQSLKIATLY